MMDLAKLTEEELMQLAEAVAQKKDELLKNKNNKEKQEASKFNAFLIANRDVILPLVKHIDDCDGENGFLGDSQEKYCPACHLKEILDGEWVMDTFKVEFTVKITELED